METCSTVEIIEHNDNGNSQYMTELIVKEASCKQILFEIWQRIDDQEIDARSPLGDMALRLRDALFKSEEEFFETFKNHNEFLEWEKENEKSS